MKEITITITKLANGYLVMLTVSTFSTSFFVKDLLTVNQVAKQFLEEEKSMADILSGLEP